VKKNIKIQELLTIEISARLKTHCKTLSYLKKTTQKITTHYNKTLFYKTLNYIIISSEHSTITTSFLGSCLYFRKELITSVWKSRGTFWMTVESISWSITTEVTCAAVESNPGRPIHSLMSYLLCLPDSIFCLKSYMTLTFPVYVSGMW
jgi:hypothetical protein